MLKARVNNDPQVRYEQLGYCFMALRSSVHCSTEHELFKRISLDVMIGSGSIGNESNYCLFVRGLQDNLAAAYRDVRQNLQAAQHCQKDAYDKGVRHMVFQAGDLMLCYNPLMKSGEANKYHRQ